MGFRVETLASDTWEEAPYQWGVWFRQRVRWQKGWMQTLLVHTRNPRRLLDELGIWRTTSAIALIGGSVFGGLFGAAFMIETATRLLISALRPGFSAVWYGDIMTLGLFLWGVQSIVVPTALVMKRRRMPGLGRVLAQMPFYFVAIAFASWAALFDLFARPFHWSKTAHGRAKPQRAAAGPRYQGTAATSR